MLAVNDHVLKGSGWLPGVVTGKLSDVAGLAFFPLLLTAVADTLLLVPARLGARIDFSLRRSKTIVATIATGAVFAALKLSPAVAAAAERGAASLGWGIEIVPDPTDLATLPAMVVALLIARAELRRLPLGRLEVLDRRRRRDAMSDDELRGALDDVDPAMRDELATAIATYWRDGEPQALENALHQLRGGSKGASPDKID